MAGPCHRRYVDSGRCWIETKFRTRTGRTESAAPTPARAAEPKRTEPAIANGRNGRTPSEVESGVEQPKGDMAAAEMPKAPEIPEKRRPSLIDRITGLGKG